MGRDAKSEVFLIRLMIFKCGKVNISGDIEQTLMIFIEIRGLEGGGVINT